MISRIALLAGAFVASFSAGARADMLSEAAGHYEVAPTSSMRFAVDKLGGGALAGSFGDFTGSVDLDRADLARSRVVFTLRPASVVTGQPREEAFLRSSAVFWVDKYPEVTFASRRVVRRGENEADIEGRLTARGKSLSATFHARLLERHKGRLTVHVVGRIARDPYDMGVGVPIYSNFVDFDMTLLCRRG